MVAPDALHTCLAMAVDVVLCAEEALRLRNSHVDVKRVAVVAELNVVRADPVVNGEPRVDGVDGNL